MAGHRGPNMKQRICTTETARRAPACALAAPNARTGFWQAVQHGQLVLPESALSWDTSPGKPEISIDPRAQCGTRRCNLAQEGPGAVPLEAALNLEFWSSETRSGRTCPYHAACWPSTISAGEGGKVHQYSMVCANGRRVYRIHSHVHFSCMVSSFKIRAGIDGIATNVRIGPALRYQPWFTGRSTYWALSNHFASRIVLRS
ncbi:hypothetical protein BC628DRAFT_214443 [Trametes gibbosa]|nr:hypothetical protein BC628DRAFT_214443 [Trametes gibbosa]